MAIQEFHAAAVGGATAGFAPGVAAVPAGFGNNTGTEMIDLPTTVQQVSA